MIAAELVFILMSKFLILVTIRWIWWWWNMFQMILPEKIHFMKINDRECFVWHFIISTLTCILKKVFHKNKVLLLMLTLGDFCQLDFVNVLYLIITSTLIDKNSYFKEKPNNYAKRNTAKIQLFTRQYAVKVYNLLCAFVLLLIFM